MGKAATQTRHNRTITIDFQDETPSGCLLDTGKACVEFVLAFLLALGFQLTPKATCRGAGCLPRHWPYRRIRLGGVILWRLQCTTGQAVGTVLPHCGLQYRAMRLEVARDTRWATHGGLRVEVCAVRYHRSPMALSRLVCALGSQSLVPGLTRCGLPLPVSVLVEETHRRGLPDKVSLPTMVSGCGTLLPTAPPRREQRTGSVCDAASRTRRRGGMPYVPTRRGPRPVPSWLKPRTLSSGSCAR